MDQVQLQVVLWFFEGWFDPCAACICSLKLVKVHFLHFSDENVSIHYTLARKVLRKGPIKQINTQHKHRRPSFAR